MILMIDNYDSFTYNLVRYFQILKEEIVVYQNDQITISEINAMNPEAIILSPGPKRPEDAKICIEIVKELGGQVPIFGVCLGHQVIGYVNGCKVVKAPTPVHGKVDKVQIIAENRLVENIPRNFNVTRYHSLHVINNEELIAIGQTTDGINMINQVRNQCTYSVQYHPESFLTEYGLNILQNFLNLAREYNDQNNR